MSPSWQMNRPCGQCACVRFSYTCKDCLVLAWPHRDTAAFCVTVCVSMCVHACARCCVRVHFKVKVKSSRIINVTAFLYNVKSNPGTAPSGGSAVQFNLGCRASKWKKQDPCLRTLGQCLRTFHLLFIWTTQQVDKEPGTLYQSAPKGQSIQTIQPITQIQGKGLQNGPQDSQVSFAKWKGFQLLYFFITT